MVRLKIVSTKNEKELNPNAPEIIYPYSFRHLNAEEKIAYLKKLSSSLNHEIDIMQRERDKAISKIARLESLTENLQITIEKNRELFIEQINRANEREQELKNMVIERDQHMRIKDRIIKTLSRNDEIEISCVA